jgi:hypothetical protein
LEDFDDPLRKEIAGLFGNSGASLRPGETEDTFIAALALTTAGRFSFLMKRQKT